jgi:hypothetical protein
MSKRALNRREPDLICPAWPSRLPKRR